MTFEEGDGEEGIVLNLLSKIESNSANCSIVLEDIADATLGLAAD